MPLFTVFAIAHHDVYQLPHCAQSTGSPQIKAKNGAELEFI